MVWLNLWGNRTDEAGETALFDGCSSAVLAVVKVLVEEGGININHKNEKGETAFDFADNLGFGEVRHGAGLTTKACRGLTSCVNYRLQFTCGKLELNQID